MPNRAPGHATGKAVRWKPRWIASPERGILRDHSLITIDGSIQEIVPNHQVHAATETVEWKDTILLPTPINAHCHLDLSAFDQPIPAEGHFTDWLSRVVAHRRSSILTGAEAFDRGLQMLQNFHTPIVGDILASPDVEIERQCEGLRGTLFLEVIGLKPERYEPLWKRADFFRAWGGGPFVGFSPHAPYSTAREVYSRAAENRFPGTHWFETPDEREFLATGKGPFREFLERIGAWAENWKPIVDPWKELLGNQAWVLFHANYLTQADLEYLGTEEGRRQVRGVVYCPRTHAHFGHPPHPAPELLRQGIPVALGTDSLASNPDLNVWKEAMFLAGRSTGLSPHDLLRMATVHGAVALGQPWLSALDEVGAPAFAWILRPSKPRDETVWHDLFDPSTNLVGVLSNGRYEEINPV